MLIDLLFQFDVISDINHWLWHWSLRPKSVSLVLALDP